VKITNYNPKLFTFLKTRISSQVHWFILASLIISIAYSLPCGENMTFTKVLIHQNVQNEFLIFLLGSLLPFLILCVAFFLLIQYLWTHIRHMRCSGAGFRSPSLEVHFRAVKSMGLFLVLHIIYLAFMNVLLSSTQNITRIWMLFISIIICSPPFLHSLNIIFSNGTLKETFLNCFCCN
ncbi:taste receptor type 2 member 7-like, partial [Eleutherodactylus coqui]|uniref:taste receptor type 2 member 7-like n=1 Tax=Eleutherodactylus coqui TaxID=57060 RepID=UPI003461E3A1